MVTKDIMNNNKMVGCIEYVQLLSDTIIIHDLTVYTPFRNVGTGKKAVFDLFNDKKIKQIVGLAANQSVEFWEKIGCNLSEPVNDIDDKYFILKRRETK